MTIKSAVSTTPTVILFQTNPNLLAAYSMYDFVVVARIYFFLKN